MGIVAHFKFIGEVNNDGSVHNMNVDEVPARLSADVVSADLRTLLAAIYDGQGGNEAVGTGTLIYGNNTDGVEAPVFQVTGLIKQYWDFVGTPGIDTWIMVFLRDVSTEFQTT